MMLADTPERLDWLRMAAGPRADTSGCTWT